MPGVTRRGFLATSVTTAAGVAGIGALAAAAPHLTGVAEVPTTATAGPLMAYVRDGSRGELSLMVGTQEVSLHDPDLVRRLHAAASDVHAQAASASMFGR